jgi:uncharacterized protein (DUF1810 family)
VRATSLANASAASWAPSSMTLFAHATADNRVFMDDIQKYLYGAFDPMTLEQIQS